MRSSMLELLSSNRETARAVLAGEKKLSSCGLLSSKIEKSSADRPLTWRPLESATETFSKTSSTPARKDGRFWAYRTAPAANGSNTAQSRRADRIGGVFILARPPAN